jgi:two-component system chemotaxis response regulator CheY
MQVSVMNSAADNTLLKLPEILDLAAAEGFLDLMRQRLENGEPLRIDASAVETLTFPCIQIILAAMRSCDRISIEHASIAFVSAFEDLAIDFMQGRAQAQVQPQVQPQDQAQDQSSENIQQLTSDQGKTQCEVGHPDQDQPNESAMAKRILTIDDSKTMRDMLMVTLADAGFDVLQAVDGQDGLDVLGKERVDVIITDINMPKMDGYEVIRQLRGNPDHKATPILVLTTESELSKKKLAREVGATGWMVKPFDPDRLVATIRKVAP